MSPTEASTERIGGSSGRQRRLALSGMIAAVLVTTGLLVTTIAFIVAGRQAAVERAEDEMANAAKLVAGQFERALSEADRALRYIELLASRTVLTDENLYPVLKRGVADLAQMSGIVLLDLQGDVIAGSAASPARRVNLGDRPYYLAARDDPDGGLHIGVPLRSRIDGGWILPVSRAMRDAEGQMVAVLAGTLSVDYFRGVLGSTLPADGRIQVVRDDGIVMLREPPEDDNIGRDISDRPLFRAAAGRQHGVLTLTDPAGVERLIAFQRVAGFPLLVTTGIRSDLPLRDWRLTTAVLLGGALVLGCFIVLLAWTLVRGVDRMIAQEAELTEASALLDTTLAHMGQGVVVVDGADTVVLSNRQLPPLLGVEEELGAPGTRLDQLAGAAGLEAELFAGAAGPEVERRLEDGRWVALQVDAMPGGRLVTLVDDITRRKEVEAELRQLVTTDPLTRLPNRRAFFDRAAREHAAVAAGGLPATVALIDVDHFKRLNDTHGHLAGDRALRLVAASMRGALDRGDMLARIGGEEFAVLMPARSLDQAAEAIQHLRASVEEMAVPTADDGIDAGIIRCTVSAGVAVLGPGGPDAALAAADRALYRAKAAGRNRVEIAAEPDLSDP